MWKKLEDDYQCQASVLFVFDDYYFYWLQACSVIWSSSTRCNSKLQTYPKFIPNYDPGKVYPEGHGEEYPDEVMPQMVASFSGSVVRCAGDACDSGRLH